MNALKLATIALGLAAVGVGYFLIPHNAYAGAGVVGVGTHLLGQVFPELFPTQKDTP